MFHFIFSTYCYTPAPRRGREYTVLPLSFLYQISVINSCWEKCDEKCAYMFNVYKNQLSRQTGSRNLMSSKTLPTIWGTYMRLVTKYQISAINSCWEKCDEKCAYMFNYWWQKSDVWSQASYRYPILWEAFFDPSDSYFLFAEERGYHRWAMLTVHLVLSSIIFLKSTKSANRK
jgi:hypothetical protein